jgi:galactose mutarotase-like enzyme
MKKNLFYSLIFYFVAFLFNNVFSSNCADTIVLSQNGYVVTKNADANGWIYKLSDTIAKTYIEVYQKGATIKKFIAYLNGIRYSIYSESNGVPKMMPWPNRTAGGKFTDSNGIVYDLFTQPIMTQNDGAGNAIHGMVSERPWQVAEVGVDFEGVYIKCFFDTQGWPVISGIFGEFRDYSVYHLKGNILIFDAYTENKSNKTFWNCGWGWHPWINAPLVPLDGTQKGTRDRCYLYMPADSIAMVNSTKIPTGEIRDVYSYNNGYFNFNTPKALSSVNVDNFFTGLKPLQGTGYTRTVLIDYGNRVRIQYFGQYPFYPWMVIYTPSNRVCIEHQTEEVNGLNTKQNLISIPPYSLSPKGRVIVVVDSDTVFTNNNSWVFAVYKNKVQKKSNVIFIGNNVLLNLKEHYNNVLFEFYSLNGRIIYKYNKIYNAGTYCLDFSNKTYIEKNIVKGMYIVGIKTNNKCEFGKIVIR